MSGISDELRTKATKMCAPNSSIGPTAPSYFRDLADRIDAEMVELPKDRDGEYIHIGDMMERGKARGHVIALMLSEYPKKWGGELHWGVQLEGEQAPTALDAFFKHYHAPTVEDVLREMLDAWGELPSNATNEAIVAEYAAKLRLAEVVDE